MRYQLDGEPRLLAIMKNFYDFLQDTQLRHRRLRPGRALPHDGALANA
jgi:hypothetical protein